MQLHLGSEVQRADGLSQEVARLRQSALSSRDRKVSQLPVRALQALTLAILNEAPDAHKDETANCRLLAKVCDHRIGSAKQIPEYACKQPPSQVCAIILFET